MLDIQVELSQSIFSKPKITITLPCWALQSPPHAYHATDVDRCQLLSFGSAEKHACTHFQSTRQCIHYQQLVGTLFSWNIPISSSHSQVVFSPWNTFTRRVPLMWQQLGMQCTVDLFFFFSLHAFVGVYVGVFGV